MQRLPEPELMDDDAQALAYAAADFSEPNAAFVAHFGETFPQFGAGTIVDLGCGPGDIALRLAARLPAAQVIGVDGAAAMLALARRACGLAPADVRARVRFAEAMLQDLPAGLPAADAVVSNSLLHHLADGDLLWRTARSLAHPGAALLVMDLARPDSVAEARAIVERYAANAAPVLRDDFYRSLLAAFTPAEVESQLAAHGLDGVRVRCVSDRHWLAAGRLP
jgi:ubiquinone/menaquinone biosynthesis C-methylase UbiE